MVLSPSILILRRKAEYKTTIAQRRLIQITGKLSSEFNQKDIPAIRSKKVCKVCQTPFLQWINTDVMAIWFETL